MNIKSMLLGSAAALVAVSGARAADAVVMVEPEPVEYVRVCDVYGTGFFYIPGTETCLKIGGYVRMRIQGADDATNFDIDDGGFSNDDYDVSTRVRARLNFDVREETELGTLRAYARVQATNRSTSSGVGTSNDGYVMDQAFMQLGGLTVGKLDSLWAERDGLYTDNDWSVGDFTANRVSYTYAANGFSAALSAEDDGSGDFVPDVVAQLAYEGAWGSAYVSGVFDEQRGNGGDLFGNSFGTVIDPITGDVIGGTFFSTLDGQDGDDSAFALKAGVELKDLLAAGSALKVEGHYAFDPTQYAGDQGGYLVSTESRNNRFFSEGGGAFNLNSEWQIGAGYQQKFGKLFAAVSGIYGETFDIDFIDVNGVTGVTTTGTADGGEYWGIAGNVGYQITSNFSVLGEVSYRDIDLPTVVGDFDRTAGFLEFKRSF
jgi:hypothetical protein